MTSEQTPVCNRCIIASAVFLLFTLVPLTPSIYLNAYTWNRDWNKLQELNDGKTFMSLIICHVVLAICQLIIGLINAFNAPTPCLQFFNRLWIKVCFSAFIIGQIYYLLEETVNSRYMFSAFSLTLSTFSLVNGLLLSFYFVDDFAPDSDSDSDSNLSKTLNKNLIISTLTTIFCIFIRKDQHYSNIWFSTILVISMTTFYLTMTFIYRKVIVVLYTNTVVFTGFVNFAIIFGFGNYGTSVITTYMCFAINIAQMSTFLQFDVDDWFQFWVEEPHQNYKNRIMYKIMNALGNPVHWITHVITNSLIAVSVSCLTGFYSSDTYDYTSISPFAHMSILTMTMFSLGFIIFLVSKEDYSGTPIRRLGFYNLGSICLFFTCLYTPFYFSSVWYQSKFLFGVINSSIITLGLLSFIATIYITIWSKIMIRHEYVSASWLFFTSKMFLTLSFTASTLVYAIMGYRKVWVYKESGQEIHTILYVVVSAIYFMIIVSYSTYKLWNTEHVNSLSGYLFTRQTIVLYTFFAVQFVIWIIGFSTNDSVLKLMHSIQIGATTLIQLIPIIFSAIENIVIFYDTQEELRERNLREGCSITDVPENTFSWDTYVVSYLGSIHVLIYGLALFGNMILLMINNVSRGYNILFTFIGIAVIGVFGIGVWYSLDSQFINTIRFRASGYRSDMDMCTMMPTWRIVMPLIYSLFYCVPLLSLGFGLRHDIYDLGHHLLHNIINACLFAIVFCYILYVVILFTSCHYLQQTFLKGPGIWIRHWHDYKRTNPAQLQESTKKDESVLSSNSSSYEYSYESS